MNENQIEKMLKACYSEFCDLIGDSPCGCDICPYQEFNTDDNEYGCEEAYINEKLEMLKGTDNND